MKPTDYKLVLVVWNDATSNDSWVKLKDVVEDSSLECATVGWLVADKTDRLVIVASIDMQDEDELVSGHVTIPRSQIKSLQELTIKKARKPKTEKIITTVDT